MVIHDKHGRGHSRILPPAAHGNLLDFPDLARNSGKGLTTPQRRTASVADDDSLRTTLVVTLRR
jgi:hypothetical protein